MQTSHRKLLAANGTVRINPRMPGPVWTVIQRPLACPCSTGDQQLVGWGPLCMAAPLTSNCAKLVRKRAHCLPHSCPSASSDE